MDGLGSNGKIKRCIHWQKTASPAPECSSLNGDIEADFVVVGGGLTGTRTALGLAEQGASVALLEAKEIGWGASGRSGGQCNPMWRATPDEICQRLGDACAIRLIETTLTSADTLFSDIETYNIDCDAEQNGWIQAAHCGSAQKNFEHLGSAWKAVGAQIDFMDRAATQRASGSKEYRFSLFHPRGGHVQPLSLTRGFAHTALGFGAGLYNNSPVRTMSRSGNRWKVATDSGSVTAAQIILTTNGYSDGLWPKLQQTFFAMVSISLATAPVPEALQREILPNRVTIADSRRAIYYSRYDRDNRLIFGCVGSSDNPSVLGGIGRLKRGLRTVFPQLEEHGIEAAWGGRIAVTPEMMPHLHEPQSGVLAGLGFSGRGIAMSSVMARTLVKKALGAADDTLPFPVSDVRPIPFHSVTRSVLPLAAPAMALRDRLDSILDPS